MKKIINTQRDQERQDSSRNSKGGAQEVLVALLFSAILLQELSNNIIRMIIPIDNALGIVMLALCFAIIVVSDFVFSKKIIWLIIFILFEFWIGFLRNPGSITTEYFLFFLVFGLSGLLGSSMRMNVKKIILSGVIITGINLIILGQNSTAYIENHGQFIFGYMMQSGMFVLIIYSLNYIQEKSLVYKILILLLTSYTTWLTISNSGRGSILCIFMFILIYLIFVSKYKMSKYIGFISIIVGIVMLRSIETYLVLIDEILRNYDIVIASIQKSIWLLNHESLMHGRTELYAEVFSFVSLPSLIFGNGIGFYERGEFTYTHNLVLSIFSDFGIIGMVGILWGIRKFMGLLKNEPKEMLFMYTILIAGTLTKLMFSSTYWYSSSFWLVIGLLLIRNPGVRENNINKIPNDTVECT